MAGKSGSNVGSQWNTCVGTTLDVKLVRKVHLKAWKVPKNGQFWAKNAIFGHQRPQRPPMAGKSGTNCKSQWNTCGGTTVDAKLVRKCTQWYGNGPKMANFGQKTPFLAIRGPKGFRWLVKVDQRVDHSGTHVGGLL